MKPQLLKVSLGPASSFSVRRDVEPFINNKWHYHSEIELIHFKEGSGTQFVGDHISTFRSGDAILVGMHLPHYWSFDQEYFDNIKKRPDVRVAHFAQDFWGKCFLELPENQSLNSILQKATRGIQITGKTCKMVADLLEQMLVAQGYKKIILLIEALNIIAVSNEIKVLSSLGFKQVASASETERINAIYQYSLANYRKKIAIEEISAIANLSPNSFCRYFKSKTRKTYSTFILEIRIGVACKLLLQNRMSIKQVCYESGFNNFASFHKYFKAITHKTPLNYQEAYLQKK